MYAYTDAPITNHHPNTHVCFQQTARIKRIMKLDPEVKSASKDATLLIAKATVRASIDRLIGLSKHAYRQEGRQAHS